MCITVMRIFFVVISFTRKTHDIDTSYGREINLENYVLDRICGSYWYEKRNQNSFSIYNEIKSKTITASRITNNNGNYTRTK